MTPNEIKFNTIKLINGIKYMTKNQVEDCKAYVRHSLNIDNTDENNNAIEEAIKIYFEQPVQLAVTFAGLTSKGLKTTKLSKYEKLY